MAQTKKTINKNRNKKKSSPAKAQKYVLTEKEIKIRNEIKLLGTLALMILIELSCFGLLDPLGGYVSYFIFGLFGICGYIMPVISFLGIAFLISNRKNRNAVIKFVFAALFVILFISMIQLIFYGYDGNKTVFDYYKYAGINKLGGGFFGALVTKGIYNIIGLVGAYVVLLILIIICIVIVTEKSFVTGVKKSSEKVYTVATKDFNKIRDASEEKPLRMNKKSKGVSIVNLEKPDRQKEDVHEITSYEAKSEQLYKGHVDINEEDGFSYEDYEKKEKKVDTIKNSKDESTDEEGFFKPTEKIEVSDSAKKVMARKAFSTFEDNNKVKENIEEKQDNTSINKKNRKDYILPRTNLLNRGKQENYNNDARLKETALKLKTVLNDFGVRADVTDYSRGPSVTRYEIQPETGIRLNKITSLTDDIKLNMAATDIRIEPIPGKSTVGIEIPNEKRESVFIRDLIESKELINHPSKLAFAAGKDIAGKVIIGDIAKMPHMLVAGTTGSGKSVFTNSIIMSILFRAKPDEVRLIIVDPKVVEFGVYNGIPHLLQPVVTDPRLASNTLKWAVAEMSDRYKKFADLNVRDLKGYNEKIKTIDYENEEEKPKKLPQIVIVIDELADLMMVAAKEVEESICRIAQLARAAGIHLVIATQRPSVDVVTGLIKANVPSRVALMVSSGVDSRTIIDSNGAEKLLGNGDMLFYPSGYPKPVRLQGAFVSDEEVQTIVNFWTEQAKEPQYDESIAEYVANQPEISNNPLNKVDSEEDGRDEYFFDAARFVVEKKKASTSMLQRVFKIGFNRAARIMDQLEEAGIVGQEEGTKPRKVLYETNEELEVFLNM